MADPADTLTALKTYLDPDVTSQWTDPELLGVIASETAAQLARVRRPVSVLGAPLTPSLYPADLNEALLRRCARNLAMRKAPLGLSFSGEAETTRLSSADPEIRRLEGPYRKMVVG